MTHNAILEQAPELTAADYVVVGVATCFRRTEDDLESIKVFEPIPSAYLESLLQGIPTSYEVVKATTLGELENDGFISQFGIADIHLCDNYRDRLIAAARTYQGHPTAQSHIAIGTQRNDLNYSTEKKRVLNVKNVVKAEDNIRQHAHTHKRL